MRLMSYKITTMTEQETFDLLSEPIKHYIRKKGWSSFRAIQKASIDRIINNDKNFILVSSTASGKTEAAFLPVLSKVDFSQKGVAVLYISPLIALINDQIGRVEELCLYLDIPVTKWHGEASQSAKKSLLKEPRGVMLTTPESLEAMFINHPENIVALFSNLSYIIVDELHYFLGTDRGLQLQSIVTRLLFTSKLKCNIIGLSATITDFTAAKDFTGDASNTVVLKDKTPREINVRFAYYDGGGKKELPIELVKDVFKTTLNHKSLIFPNSRGRVEELSVKLQKLNRMVDAGGHYFSHHSSVEKEIREYVEKFAKHCDSTSFSICCTSTLELGIDIGNVDEVVQVDATSSVSSLVQRAGRSGRREGEHASISIYSTSQWSLLQAIACWRLNQKNILEKPEIIERPYDIFLHQLLSVVKQHSEITLPALINVLLQIKSFRNITHNDCKQIIRYLISPESQVLELLNDKIIIGIEGEKIVNSRDFYSVFKPELNFTVYNKDNKIGLLQPFWIPPVGSNIFLAAKIWTITEVDNKSKKVFVEPAIDGIAPIFTSDKANVDFIVEQEMLEILYSPEQYNYLDKKSSDVLDELRKSYSFLGRAIVPIREIQFKVEQDLTCESDDTEEYVEGTEFVLFFGTKINKSISFLFSTKYPVKENGDNFIKVPIAYFELKDAINNILNVTEEEINMLIKMKLNSDKTYLYQCSKFGQYLPIEYQIEVIKQKMYDFTFAKETLTNIYNAL